MNTMSPNESRVHSAVQNVAIAVLCGAAAFLSLIGFFVDGASLIL